MLPPENMRYDGAIAVLVGPNCVSACEFFSYDMTINNRAAIVGHYPTAGGGGGIERFFMPEGLTLQMTIGRNVDGNGNIHIEGRGVVPTVRVPVTEETLFSDGDPVLEAAIEYLNNNLGGL
jgi:C-terminal processing protease CtpA/Prc